MSEANTSPDASVAARPDTTLDAADAGPDPDAAPEAGPEEGAEREGLTPRQARRVRIVLSALIMLAAAAVLALRLGSTHSMLTVGFYGMALILSGSALVLSKQGRTRVATAVLGLGVAVALAGEWAVASMR
ncbi:MULTISPECIES: hypothetical protein [Streptomyces]|uniref:Uncharacterized protein n=1 Tax=Streptomyces chengmaiensis TaxID=3040919 RepID=A0ABT6HWY6_9ACTN|nr:MULTISPECIES: hypothetical protein [Streptomyces]MDH2392808.1 hypothetical protein [Streptomyces chengmaiensis]WRQ80086.1 hypothetical protein I3F59_012405 [Streptomyces sp. MUM 178J]